MAILYANVLFVCYSLYLGYATRPSQNFNTHVVEVQQKAFLERLLCFTIQKRASV